MAEKLSIQIALEGGREIEKQLADIGDAGQKAFDQIAKSAEQVGGFKNLKPEEVTAKLKDLGVAGTDAFQKIQNAVASASRFERVVTAVQSVENAFIKVGQAALSIARAAGPILAVGAAMVSLAKSTLKTANAFNAINAAAMKAGLTFEEFDKLSLGFEKMGISAKDAAAGIQHFKEQLDKLELSNITEALKELEEAAKRGFGAQGTAQLALLQKAAAGTGKSAEEARKALEKLGLPIPEGAQTTLRQLGVTATNTAEAMQQAAVALAAMPDNAQRTALAFDALGDTMGPKFIAFLQAGGGSIEQYFANLNARTQQQAVQAARLEEAWNRLNSAWQRMTNLTFSDTIITGIDLLTAAIEKCGQVMTYLNDLWARLKADGVASWEMLTKAVDKSLAQINAVIQAIWDAIKALGRLLGLGQQVGGGSGTNPVTAPQGFAGGGPIGGRGSGTSDSNLAWVSRGEHIMPARAVSQPGVLAFLEALRRSGGNLRNVLDGMGRFALGGPVALPAFAGGGLNSMSNVTIQFPGLAPIGGLRAPADVVEELRKAAAMAQVRSGGTKPSRYR